MTPDPLKSFEAFSVANPVGTILQLEVKRKLPPSIIQLKLPENLQGGIHVSELHWNMPLSERAFMNIEERSILEVEVKNYNSENHRITFTRKKLVTRPSESEAWGQIILGEEQEVLIVEMQANRSIVRFSNDVYGYLLQDKTTRFKRGEKKKVIPIRKNIAQELIECSSPESISKAEQTSHIITKRFDSNKYTGAPLISDPHLVSFEAFKSSFYATYASEEELAELGDLFQNTPYLFSKTLIGSLVYFLFDFDKAIDELSQHFLPAEQITLRERLSRLADQSFWYSQFDKQFRLFNESISIAGIIRDDEIHVVRSVKSGIHASALGERLESLRQNEAYFLCRPVGFYYVLDAVPIGAENKEFIEQVQNKNMAFAILQKSEALSEKQLKEEGKDFVLFHNSLDALLDRELLKARQSSIELSNCKLTSDLQLERTIFQGYCKTQGINVGDQMSVYGKATNDRISFVGKGIVIHKTDNSLTISLPSFDIKTLNKGCIMRRLPNTIQYAVQIEVLDNFLNHNLNQESLYKVFHDPSSFEPAEDAEVEFINRNIDSPGNKQAEAVRKAIGNKNIVLIQGPPGTGKTTVITEIIRQLIKRGERLLVASQTHVAVDNVLRKIGEDKNLKCVRIGSEESVAEESKPFLVNQSMNSFSGAIKQLNDNKIKMLEKKINGHDFIVGDVGVELKENLDQFTLLMDRLSPEETIQLHGAMNEWRTVAISTPHLFADLFLHNQDIVFGTCIGIATNYSYSKSDILFNTVILDEAGKANISETLTAISRAQKIILVGDHKQLPPFLNKEDIDYIRSLRAYEHLDEASFFRALGISLFEFLQKDGVLPEQNKIMLNIQHRMHPDIANFISTTFYNDVVENGPSTLKNRLPLPKPFNAQVIFIDTSGDINRGEKKENNSYYNPLETEFIFRRVIPILFENKIDFRQVAIITPYKEQQEKIRELFSQKGISMEVATLDSFQGKEYDIIILSFTRSFPFFGKVGFLDDLRRLNVALSRARKKLIFVGDASTLLRSKAHYSPIFADLFHKLVIYVRQNGNFYRINDLKPRPNNEVRTKQNVRYEITAHDIVKGRVTDIIENPNQVRGVLLDLGKGYRGSCIITDTSISLSIGQIVTLQIKTVTDKYAECIIKK